MQQNGQNASVTLKNRKQIPV